MPEKAKVLLVDDAKMLLETWEKILRRKGCNVTSCQNATEAINAARASRFHVAVTDVRMPGMSGVDLILEFKKIDPQMVVIVLTAYGDVNSAVTAMKRGAFDYLTKPIKAEDFLVAIQNAVQERRQREESADRREGSEDQKSEFCGILGASKPMQEVFALVRKIAMTDATVLIRGKTGTGKELIARAIHYQSSRRNKPFVPINCGAITENLVETEFFGHMAGAFTDAKIAKKGLFEVADGGTLFLDEIGDVPTNTQVKLLRALEEKEVKRVGGTDNIKVNVRVVAATSRDLELAIQKGEFRQELFYRLNVFQVTLPDLKDRREDIPLLVPHFIQKFARGPSSHVKGVSPEALDLLMNYEWPGNVRELENTIERACLVTIGSEIAAEDIRSCLPLPRPVQKFKDREKEDIVRALRESGGNRSKAAERLGIDRKTLYLKINRYGLQDTED